MTELDGSSWVGQWKTRQRSKTRSPERLSQLDTVGPEAVAHLAHSSSSDNQNSEEWGFMDCALIGGWIKIISNPPFYGLEWLVPCMYRLNKPNNPTQNSVHARNKPFQSIKWRVRIFFIHPPISAQSMKPHSSLFWFSELEPWARWHTTVPAQLIKLRHCLLLWYSPGLRPVSTSTTHF